MRSTHRAAGRAGRWFPVAAVTTVVASLAPSTAHAAPTTAASGPLSGCAYKAMCVVDSGSIVFSAVGDSDGWPSKVNDRADRIINNGSKYDVIVYEHDAATRASGKGWALCVPQGKIVSLGGLQPAVLDQASSHEWMGTGYCGGKVTWLRTPGSTGTGFALAAVNVARTQVGVREVPPNKGARVTEYQKSVRNDAIALGQPWCASFISWAFLQAKDPTPYRSAAVGDWVRMANAGRYGMSFVREKDVRVGDLVAFKKYGGWQHMGIVSSVGSDIMLISGNTTGKTRRAEGVYDKPVSNWTKLGYTVAYIRNDR